MRTASELWGQLSDAEVAIETQRFQTQRAKNVEIKNAAEKVASLVPSMTPHGLGDSEWAISPGNLWHLVNGERMRTIATRWHAQFGRRVRIQDDVQRCDDTTPVDSRTRAEIFGQDTCVEHLSEDTRARQARIVSVLNLLQRFHRTDPKKMLLRIAYNIDVPRDDATPEPAIIIIISLCALYNSPPKQKYFNCSGDGPIVPGAAITLRRLSFTTNAACA
jgi:hypothetical protein